MPEIGETLREARMRAHIDVSEIEAQTKIRSKYLRAMENEEWDLLPGPTYVTSFLRTYARALGLDSKQLLEEYRKGHERGSEEQAPIQGPRRPRPNEPQSRGLGPRLLLGVLGVVAALLVVGLITQVLDNGGKKKHDTGLTATHSTTQSTITTTTHTRSTKHARSSRSKLTAPISLQLIPTGQVYVCLVARGDKVLVPGLVLAPGQGTKVFHSRHFYLVLGDSNVRLRIDGTDRVVPPSATPIGYSITKKGRHRESTSKLPTCG